MNKKIVHYAIKQSLPITCSYLFVSFAYGIGIPKMAGVFLTGISYIWKHNTFLSIILGTIGYMFLIQLV